MAESKKKHKKEYLSVFAAGVVGILIVSIASTLIVLDLNKKIQGLNKQLNQVNNLTVTVTGTGNFSKKIVLLHTLLSALKNKSTELSKKYSVGIRPLVEGFSTNPVGCGGGGKVTIYAFHSPTCPYCEAQRPVLDELAQEYSGKVDVKYVCVTIHEGDEEKCRQSTEFLPYNIGKQIYEQYKFDITGTPTLVFNCDYKRVGSYAVYDQQRGTNIEKELLETVVNTLLSS